MQMDRKEGPSVEEQLYSPGEAEGLYFQKKTAFAKDKWMQKITTLPWVDQNWAFSEENNITYQWTCQIWS